MRITRTLRVLTSVILLGLITTTYGVGVATADPDTAHVTSVDKLTDQHWVINVYSPAMDSVEALDVLVPADGSIPAPTLYALNGAGQGILKDSGWFEATDIVDFFADKQVNVVSPRGGNFSYYADWISDDPALGRNKWETFLTKELPPVIDAELGTSGVNSIMGMSMSASSSLFLTAASGDLYQGVASFSGCARTTDEIGYQYMKLVVETRGKGKLENMWGERDNPLWARHDMYLNAEQLRGKTIYLSSRTGLPGRFDNNDNVRLNGDRPYDLADQIILGGGIEVATGLCTRQVADRLAQLGIPAVTDLDEPGSHSWSYWEQDMRKAWPTLAKSMGIPA
ncbi:alpha/beta hydrolase [Gordonia rubripertincta]|uniref:Alpha/beta hydrolase family protein n=1 Tax=Gordonia rubripertincta TaxID=36822 RepID=A0ABT4MVH7_GORRU|nr:alpha/beta hydrolase family protein [Gordonia rubripertincta]MCZ4551007.1 alpha/beta hydrolase family protein [Gordonia rubripertincta]